MWYIGIDVHKKLCYACIKDRDGNVLGELTFPNRSYGIDMLLEAIEGREAKAAIESTSNLWLRVYVTLEEAGVEVLLANPKKTKAIAEAKLKNDKVDARMLADLLRADLIAPCYVPPREVRELRCLVRHRMNLVRDRTRVKNRIHALLDKYELGFQGSDLFGKTGVAWLRDITVELRWVDRLILEAELVHLEVLNQLIAEAEVRIARESVESEDVRLLMSMPGVDYYTALLFTSEVGDVKRFSSSSKLVNWLGLAPRTRESAGRRYDGGITKEGSRRVRWALVQAARVAVRWDLHMGAKYHRISRRRGDAKAIVAVAREMVVAMYHMLTRGEPYRFSNQAKAAAKLKRLERIARNAERPGGPHSGEPPKK
jgi:transposase